jgi:hypothetical protein
MKTRCRCVAVVASFCLVLGVAHGAAAQTDDSTDHANKATRAYNIQDWSNALKEFREAYRLDPKPQYLWAMAQTQRLSGDCRGATLTYKAYQRTASAEQYNQAQEWINKCQAEIAEQERLLQQQQQQPPPTQHAESPQPPPQAAPPKAEPEKPKEHGPWILDPLGDVLLVIGVGGLAVGGVFLGVGNSDMSATASLPTYQQYDKAVDSAATEQTIGVIALAGGAVFAALAVWRFAAVGSHNAKEKAATPSVGLVPQPGGAYVSYRLSF